MRAAIVTGAGVDPVHGTFGNPVAGVGELLVNVTAAALSRLTRGKASGSHYSGTSAFPFVPGVDGVGTLADGRRVYFVLPRGEFGAMAEQSVVAANQCVSVPAGLDDVTAAAIANPGMSSWAALTYRARFRAGETVLVNGATGSSGKLAVAIAKHMGAGRVVATGRNQRILDALLEAGADETVQLTGEGLEERFRAIMAGGVDVVLDYLWGDSARAILIAAAKALPDGHRLRFVQIGSLAGAEIAMPAAVLRSSAIEMMGSGIGSVSTADLLASIAAVFALAVSQGLTVETSTMPLAAVAEAWKADESAGRIVLTI